jgi:hypothetical protein
MWHGKGAGCRGSRSWRARVARRALTGYNVRQRLSRDMPDFMVALLEDALAVGARRYHRGARGRY